MPDPVYEKIRRELRRELQVRQLRPSIWNDLAHWGLVEKVRQQRFTVEQLARAYRIKEDDHYPCRPQLRRLQRRLPPDRRSEALAQIVAFRLDWLRPAVALFREEHLDGGRLAFEGVRDWVRQRAASEGRPAAALLCVPVAGYGEYPAGSRAERRQWYLDWLAARDRAHHGRPRRRATGLADR